MTKISDAAFMRAGELYEAELQRNTKASCDEAIWHEALARVLQEHSDLGRCLDNFPSYYGDSWKELLTPLILPDDPKPDGRLVRAVKTAIHASENGLVQPTDRREKWAASCFLEALGELGGRIVWEDKAK